MLGGLFEVAAQCRSSTTVEYGVHSSDCHLILD